MAGPTKKIDRITVSLPEEQSAFIERLVAISEYGSASDVVSAGIEALQDHDREMEHWLQTEVAETYDRLRADPSRGIPLEEVMAELKARHEAKLADG